MSPVPPSVARVFRAVEPARRYLSEHDARIMASQVTLAEISAPTGFEAARAQRIREAMLALDLSVSVDAADNVVALRPGTTGAPPVVVCAHMDTVFSAETPLGVRRKQERFTGPGIGDNARGLAGMVAIAEALRATRVTTERPILFAATTGEEGDGNLRGARHLFGGIASEATGAIALDGAGDERIVTHALGIRRFSLRITGPGGHSWASYGVANAVHAMATIAAELAAWRLPTAPRSALTVARIGGGTAINAVPSSAWMEVDMRSWTTAELDRMERELRTTARRIIDAENARRRIPSPALQLSIDVTGDRPAGAVPGDAFIAQAAFEATRLIGRTPEGAIASTDANVPMALGIPAIAIGAGGVGGDTHTEHEWFENRDGSSGLARAMTILVAAAGLA